MTIAWGPGHHSPLSPLFGDPPGAGVGGSAPAAPCHVAFGSPSSAVSPWWSVPRTVCLKGYLPG